MNPPPAKQMVGSFLSEDPDTKRQKISRRPGATPDIRRIRKVPNQKFSPKTMRERRASLRSKMLRVLVVENHSDTREGIQLVLKALGYHAVPAGTAAEARTLAQRETFDLLLSDITLPDGDGWQLLTELRASGREPRQSIAMSGLNSPADRARSRTTGYKTHLVKPFSPQDLEKALHHIADDLAPLAVASVPTGKVRKRWRQRLHDGLSQQLAASSLLQAALVNRLEALGRSESTTGAPVFTDGAASEALNIAGEARRIGKLIHEALEETHTLMSEMQD